MQTIQVKPIDGAGWMVEVSGIDNPQVFASGVWAESAARGLARKLADAGRHSQITVYLRDGSVAGRFISAP